MNKTVLRLAIPNILSNISIPLLGIVDTLLMGHLDSDIYIGAIGLGSVIFSFIFWGFGFLRMGTTGMTAQAFGRKDMSQAMTILGQAALVAMGGSVLVLLLQNPIADLSFYMINGDESVEALARSYFHIRIFAAPASLGLFAIHGWFLGMQNAKYPMILTIVVNAFNIIFSVALVFGLDMKSDGVALGTVIAQYLGLLLALFLMWKKYPHMFPHLAWEKVIDWVALKRFFSVNADLFIRTMCLVFVFAFFTAKSAEINNETLAINQILQQFLMLMAYGVDGFAYAAESLVGRFTGSGEKEKLKKAVKLILMWGLGLGAVFSVLFGFQGEFMMSLFTDLPHIIEGAAPYLPWMALLPLLSSIAFIWDGVYIGATSTRAMRNTMLLATVGIFLPAFYLSFPHWGNHALWFSMNIFMLGRSLLLTFLAPKKIFL